MYVERVWKRQLSRSFESASRIPEHARPITDDAVSAEESAIVSARARPPLSSDRCA